MNNTSNAKWVLLFILLLNLPWAIVEEHKSNEGNVRSQNNEYLIKANKYF